MTAPRRPPWEEALLRHAPRVLGTLVVIVAVLSAVAVYTLLEYQPKTACERDAGGKECQRLKVDSDRKRTANSACVITRRAGLGCPALGQLGPIEKVLAALLAGEDPNEGSGDADTDGGTGPTGSGPPDDDGSGGGDPGGGGGNDSPGPPAPDDPDPPPAGGGGGENPDDPGTGGGGGTTTTPEGPAGLGEQLGEGVDDGLEGIVGAAGGLLCAAGEAIGVKPGVCP